MFDSLPSAVRAMEKVPCYLGSEGKLVRLRHRKNVAVGRVLHFQA